MPNRRWSQQEQQLQSRIVGLFNDPARRFSQIVQVETFTDAITTPKALAEQLAGSEIIVAMRERTRFDAALPSARPHRVLSRSVAQAAPAVCSES